MESVCIFFLKSKYKLPLLTQPVSFTRQNTGRPHSWMWWYLLHFLEIQNCPHRSWSMTVFTHLESMKNKAESSSSWFHTKYSLSFTERLHSSQQQALLTTEDSVCLQKVSIFFPVTVKTLFSFKKFLPWNGNKSSCCRCSGGKEICYPSWCSWPCPLNCCSLRQAASFNVTCFI